MGALALLCAGVGLLLSSCHQRSEQPRPIVLPPNTVLEDRTFHSESLHADVTYRVIRPSTFPPGDRIRVGYLLHGNGGTFREWSAFSTIADLAARGYVLVMPEGHSTYFMNSATKANDQYEDFLTKDLIADVEPRLPRPITRSSRFILDNSMGGFAALVLALRHPDLYVFAAALSPPVDVPRRAFSLHRIGQYLGFRSIFGPAGSATRVSEDPFVLARKASPASTPFLFVAVGDQESLREPVERLNRTLETKAIPHAFVLGRGGHNWQQWNGDLPQVYQSLKTAMDAF
ncbi:MAG TPA: alpha/beta hydrolase-fold protein [Acidobacteriaceae bacterium]